MTNSTLLLIVLAVWFAAVVLLALIVVVTAAALWPGGERAAAVLSGPVELTAEQERQVWQELTGPDPQYPCPNCGAPCGAIIDLSCGAPACDTAWLDTERRYDVRSED